MKPKRVKAWACGKCDYVYSDNSKSLAEMCCVCAHCSSNSLQWGIASSCEKCRKRKALEAAKRNLDLAAKELELLEKSK